MKERLTKSSLAALLIAATSACSTVPKEIRQAPPDNPPLVEARAEIDRYVGQRVRWGGTIVSVDNGPQETQVEVVGRNLYSNGRPTESDQSHGRFIAEFVGFLDPTVYSKGREITVVGVIAGEQSGKIGEFEYTWPVVRVHDYHLWPLSVSERAYYPSRYYYHYDPWYPYYYYPYGFSRPIIIHPSEPSTPPRSSPLKR